MVLAEVHILDPFSSFCAGCPSAKATCTEQVGRLAAHIWRQWFHVVFLRPIGVHFTRSTLPTCPRHKHKQLVVGFFGIHFMLNTFAMTLVDLEIVSMDFSLGKVLLLCQLVLALRYLAIPSDFSQDLVWPITWMTKEEGCGSHSTCRNV